MANTQDSPRYEERNLRELVHRCLRGALRAGEIVPADGEDWIETGLLDSMALVDVLLCVEKAAGLTGFLDGMEGRPPRCTSDAVAALGVALSQASSAKAPVSRTMLGGTGVLAGLMGWGIALGSERIEARLVEREFSLPAGTLLDRAGIESVVRVPAHETEVGLVEKACASALARADVTVSELDWILATSETFLGLPSLGASLHLRLLARETCGVLDVGGACVGLIHAMFVGSAFITAGLASCVLIASCDVHSRLLAPAKIDGTFGGLFGDGACAFVLRRTEEGSINGDSPYCFGQFSFGCFGNHADALRLSFGPSQALWLRFEGEALARAAVRRLAGIIEELESLNELSRSVAIGFALHQPNPRLVSLFAKEAGVPFDRISLVAKSCGNLGSSTCGVALSMLLDQHAGESQEERGPIFMAAVGPGMLSGGVVLHGNASCGLRPAMRSRNYS